MLTLNHYYDTDISIPINIKNVPEGVVFISLSTDAINVNVKDRGVTLMNYEFHTFLPISIDFSEMRNRGGKLWLPVAQIKKKIMGQLATSTEITSFTPDTIIYFYTNEGSKKYPVKLAGTITAAKQFELGEIEITPDSVWVYAIQRVSDTLSCVYTQQIFKKELADTLRLDVVLQENDHLRCSPQSVNVTIPITPYTEKTFELPITGIGFPKNYYLKTFPSRVKISFNVNLRLFDSINPDDFLIGINYSDLLTTNSEKAAVKLLKSPKEVSNIRLYPLEVDYLIEH